ncbi:hypothetical protein PVAND_008594 [Polypedilum vanderplanki]|uniref:Protein lingerer n=1 Tax=Polypedilum vanderplanki TaxID=319348 RepID=A0A9J6CA22_POLVA|nr:hypothetical protein PVAND_008594 [Polypedilum vanderplanki]
MSPQQKSSGGGGGRKSGGKAATGQKDSVAADQSNGQNTTNNKKHNNASSTNSTVNNNNNIDQVKTEKEKPHVKPTAEQIRIAQITEIKSGTQDPTREKVIQLMEATERSEEDACLALYECDNDLERAVIYLLENLEVGALITTTKKKKNKAAVDGDGDEFESSNNNRDTARDGNANERSKGGRSSNRGGGASNRGRSRQTGEYRGGQPRDNNNDERTKGSGPRRGGGFSGRGRGGRMGPRGRDSNNSHRNNNFRSQDHQEIDNWDPSATQNDNKIFGQEETSTWGDCGDWDNEEYTGSLSDTKVFTPSAQQDLAAPPGLEQQILNPPSADVSQYPSVVSSATNAGQYGDLHSTSNTLRQALEIGQQQSAQLSAEQSQYFNTLGSQNNNSAYQSSVQYQYNDQVVSNSQAPRSHQQQQQQQQRSRARVPPPSKIPSSAVEMPSDVDLPVYLDVQFGGLDFGSGTEEPSYETEKYSQGIDQSAGDDYTKNSSVSKSSQSALGGLQPSQLLQNADSISSSTQADLSSSYAQRNASSIGGAGATLDQLTKTGDIYSSTGAANNTYQNLSTYQSTQKSGGYQTTGYGSNAYNSTQSSTNNYPASSTNAYGYNQNSYQQNQGTQNGTTGQQQTQTSGTGVSSNTANPNQPINSNTTGYMSNQYPAQSGFQQNSYQSQSVYGNSNNLNSNTEFSGSINSLTSKLKTQGTYDSSTNAVSSGTASTSSNTAITTSSINTSSLGLNNAKSTTSSSMKTGASQVTSSATSATTNNNNASSTGMGTTNTGNGASNVVQNIPLVSSYIQPAFYQQQPYLHFEDMQLVQPRMTPMTGYYEYQTPTSLAGVRGDGTASNLASVAYPTMSTDGRFARTDNSSPVQSQQTGSSQLMNALPPYAAYFYGTNVMPGGFQQFPQIYSQMPATNPNATQFAKQSAYSSGYSSTGYDATAPEYNKTTYQSTGQQTKGHSTTNQSGTNSDIASSMYNKSHVTLNKVNSYDKQSFHSGTPPPFNLNSQAGSQTQAAYQQHLYLQPMAPHHNINMHQPIHQMEGGRISGGRRDTNSSGQRQQSGNQSKSGTKPGYSSTYWNTQN